MKRISSLRYWYCMTYHQCLSQCNHGITCTINCRNPFKTFLPKFRTDRIAIFRLSVYILRDKQITLRSDFLPPLKSCGLLDGDMLQRCRVTV